MNDPLVSAMLKLSSALDECIRQIAVMRGTDGYGLPPCLRLPKQQAIILRTLLGTDVATRERLMWELYRDKPPATSNVLDSQMRRLRTTLAKHDVTILAQYGVGFSMTSEDKRKVRDLEEV